MHVLFNTWLYFCRMTQTRAFIRAFAVANGKSARGATAPLFMCWHLPRSRLTFSWRVAAASFYPPANPPPAGEGSVGGAHVSVAHCLPSLMCLNQSGLGTNVWHSSDIMEFPLLRSSYLRDSSFDISHGWLPLRGSPPTTPPDHRWMDYEEGHLTSKRSTLQQFVLTLRRNDCNYVAVPCELNNI